MKVKVLLKHDVADLGRIGDVVDVAAGYARNYLLPQKLGLEVTPGTMQAIDAAQKKRAEIDAERKKTATEMAAAINAMETLEMPVRVSESGTLYGSVSAADIVAAMAEKGLTVSDSAVRLADAIKSLGEHTVEVKVHADISAEVKLNVVALEGADPEEGEDDDDEDDDSLYGGGFDGKADEYEDNRR